MGMMQALMAMLGGKGGGGGGGGGGQWKKKSGKAHPGNKTGGKRTDKKDEDPEGSGRVFVMGFDFGTTDEQLEGHMSQAGEIHAVHWVTKGKAVVVFKDEASVEAAKGMDNTTIEGNTRFIRVVA